MLIPRNLKRFLIPVAAASALTLGACSSTPVSPPAAPVAVAKPATAPAASGVSTGASTGATPASRVASVTLPAHLDPKSAIFQKRSVYFDFDSSMLKPDANSLVELHGKYLTANPAVAIKIEGNTDERGGAEYNLALGQRRADAVRQALKLLGVKDSQMEAISWGKERPKAGGHDEAAWTENRRADLVYPSR